MRPLVASHPQPSSCTVPVGSRHVPQRRHACARVFQERVSLTVDLHAAGPSTLLHLHATEALHPAAKLLQWVVRNGGVVHPSLVVTDNAPCGCRGVVATTDITISSCSSVWSQYISEPPVGPNGAHPLIAVPEELCLTDQDALQLLSQAMQAPAGTVITKSSNDFHSPSAVPQQGQHISSNATKKPGQGTSFLQQAAAGLGQLLRQAATQPPSTLLQQRLHQLHPPMLLALLLAHQRRLEQQSFWHPYISNLPDMPPCAWFDSVERQLSAAALGHPHQVLSAHQQLPNSSTKQSSSPAAGGPAFEAAAAAVAAKCSAAASFFGPALGGLTAAEVAWAYGQVASRAFSTGGPDRRGIVLLPVVDMLNHAAGAAVPVCWQQGRDQGQEEAAGVSAGQQASSGGLWCVWHQQLTGWDTDPTAAADTAIKSGCGSSSSSSSTGEGAAGAEEVEGADDVVLRCGEELYVSYMSTVDAAAALLSFGFIPPELQQR